MLEPLRPTLVLPEVLDPTKWKRGKLWFMDPEEKYVLRLFSFVSAFIYINTRLAKVEEFKTHSDLLNPRWTGKIVVNDPTVPGRGAFITSVIYSRFGEEFTKKLFIDQKPVMSRDTRQVTDWIARGTYPISLEADDEQVERMKEEGFPIEIIYSLPSQPGAITSAVGQAGILSRSPHPNAARVFANWLASREGVETFSRARVHASTRSDVDESFLRKDQIPHAGVNYFDASGWDFSTVQNQKIRQRMREILKR
jgi:ABC-type Fe3+ transport system substrate-binding protein